MATYRMPVQKLSEFEREWLSLEDVAYILEASLSTARRWTEMEAEDRLPTTRLSGAVRIHRSAVVEFLNRRSNNAEFFDPGYSGHPGTLEDPDPHSDQYEL